MADRDWDVVVIGGGHAGVEAAAAAARVGARVALVTMSASDLGVMSCNPAIGGLGRGHLVREVDALGGLMGRAIDRAGIQFRVLNRSKGPAVRGPRAQADRARYAGAVQALVAEIRSIRVIEATVAGLDVATAPRRAVRGVLLDDGRRLRAPAVVLTSGTFLRGVIHQGERSWPAGRLGDRASVALAESVAALQLPIARLKTGTPPRLKGRSIDFAGLERQEGDAAPAPFSFITDDFAPEQVACHLTRTNAAGHALLRARLAASPAFSGAISGAAVRYCPSIEDKIVRFADRASHHVFLEPETVDGERYYPNGVSTAMPPDVQEAFLRTIPGLERAEIAQFGYAIEYDHVDPRALDERLAATGVDGLFLAGQINGSTGYEEAAAQGLVAGANAALGQSAQFFTLRRAEAYVGVMIDDLTRLGAPEPYRMFTSRAEHRLRLRADNADLRLTERASSVGLTGGERVRRARAKRDAIASLEGVLRSRRYSPEEAAAGGVAVRKDGKRRDGLELLATPGVVPQDLAAFWPEIGRASAEVVEQVATDAQYAPFLRRHDKEIALREREGALRLPQDLDYGAVAGLTTEARERLRAAAPSTIDQAARLPGVTPAALALLYRHARRSA